MKGYRTILSVACICILSLIIVNTYHTSASENHSRPFHSSKRMAIVIDDFGNEMRGTEEMLKLPIPLTVAVMPFLPSTERDATAAHQNGHEVIVHLPMEPVKGLKSWLGPGAITSDLSDEEIRHRVEQAIDNVPYAVGMNNHMGSKITSNEHIMEIVLSVCKERGLYYLDSKTTMNSVVSKVAERLGVHYVENNVFLDDVYTREHVAKQIKKIDDLVTEQQELIIIGHVGSPGLITSSAIKEHIPVWRGKVQIVTLSQWIEQSLIQPEIF